MTSDTGKLTVLIAEDDPDDRFFLEEALEDYKDVLDISFVEDGEKLMEYLRRRGQRAFPQPHLILLDLNMPKKDGRQALLEIKRSKKLKDIPVIIWTTSAMEGDKRFCKEAGAEGFVTKPDNFADLSSAVKEIIQTWLDASSYSKKMVNCQWPTINCQ